MAIARGAGTEIIRSIAVEEITDTVQILIFGIAHHIYTVLSVICHAQAVQADGNFIKMYLKGFDNKAGTTGRTFDIFKQDMSLAQTFVWNDKFSFMGNEPTNYTGPMNSEADQDLISDQAQATPQYLYTVAENSSDNFDVICTFIDQNNA